MNIETQKKGFFMQAFCIVSFNLGNTVSLHRHTTFFLFLKEYQRMYLRLSFLKLDYNGINEVI